MDCGIIGLGRIGGNLSLQAIKKGHNVVGYSKSDEELNSINTIKEYYGYSDEKAKSILSLLSHEQINELKLRIYKGGKR